MLLWFALAQSRCERGQTGGHKTDRDGARGQADSAELRCVQRSLSQRVCSEGNNGLAPHGRHCVGSDLAQLDECAGSEEGDASKPQQAAAQSDQRCVTLCVFRCWLRLQWHCLRHC